MMRRVLGALFVGGAMAGCAPVDKPLNVPGPTTAHPEGYSLKDPVPPPPFAVKTVTLPVAGSNVVAFRVVFAAGSADDPPGKEGLTRLTATAMVKGGTKSLTYPQLIDRLYPLAASIDVRFDRDETVFQAEIAASDVDAFTPILEEVLLAPRLDAEGLARIKAELVSQLTFDLRGSSDEALVKEVLASFVYEGHPYGHPTLGTETGLAASSLADVVSQRERVLCRERVTIGVAGAIPDGYAAKLAKDLAALPACEGGGVRAELPAPKERTGYHVVIVDKPSASAAAISMGYAYDVTRSSADFPAVTFFTDYLGLHRQSSGRLFQELREKRGLNYGDYAYAEAFEQDGSGRFARPNLARRQQLFSIWIRPVKPDDAPFAILAALREYGSLLSRGVSQPEVERYRTFLDRYAPLEAITPTRRLGYAIDDLTYGRPHPYAETMHDAWGKLDAGSLAAAARHHLHTDGMVIAIVTKNGAALASALTTGSPVKPPAYASPKPAEVTGADAEIVKLPFSVPSDHIRVVSVSDLFKE